MLKTLNIENIAVIESAKIDFQSGLNVLTGETGAGKSIVVDSINAILGERTSRELVRNGADSAFVSALFTDVNDTVKSKLTELGYETDEDNSLIISRKITSEGKSLCKINGRSATVSILKEIGKTLVNIHGQHDSQALLNPDLHYKFIDMLSSDNDLLSDYKSAFSELLSVRRKLKALTMDADEKDKNLELLDYQIKELENADIKVGELQALQNRKKIIDSSEAAVKAYSSVYNSICGNDEFAGLLLSAEESSNALEPFSEISGEIAQSVSLLNNIFDEFSQIKNILEKEISSAEFDPEEREIIEERLDLLFKLSKKYGASEEDMLKYLDECKTKRSQIDNDDREIEKLNSDYDKAYSKVLELANKLSDERKKTARKFEKDVKSQLEFLDMPKISFVVNFSKNILSSNGYDKIEFLISTNPGEPPKPLAKIASGGELSRIMLAIKNIIAYNDTVDTLIFDEIDTGVSGRASRKIGLKLKSVSKNTQVITVTHSAQIASAADEHFLIQKDFSAERTYTKVTPLDFEGRKNELARIMGGLEITDALLKSAEEMLLSSSENIKED
ncbi:MAG: DNA repair protein RecN [Eubacterium sp.]